MKDAAPFLVFAIFVGLLWLQGRRRPRAQPPDEPAPTGPAIRRLVLGNPPVNGPVDAFARFGFFAAWLLGLGAIAGGATPLLLPAGALLAVIGVLYARNAGSVRERLVERYRRSAGYRAFGADTRLTPFFGLAMSFIGVCWFALGVADLAR